MFPTQIKDGGYGVFCCDSVSKGDRITEYGGNLMTDAQARHIQKYNPEQASHLRSLYYRSPVVLDGSLRKSLHLMYYREFHLAGSFVNDGKHGKGKQDSSTNCERTPLV